jgi:hypothetical protein
MGLTLVVGILADLKDADDEGADYYRRQFDAVNRALKTHGLPLHREPETLTSTHSEDMFGYSAIHHLRHIAAYSWAGKGLPSPGDKDPDKDPIVRNYYASVDSGPPSLLSRFFGSSRRNSPRYDHLIFHSDAEGFYLPQDFAEVIFPNSRLKIAGEMIGSSVRLSRECEALATLLQIPAGLDPESDELLEFIENPESGGPPWKSHGKAVHACLKLQAACAFSLANKAAIVFA